MNWQYKLFWAAVVGISMSLAACGQKKDDNNGRPQLPPGAKAGAETGNGGKTVVSSAAVSVAGQIVQVSETNIAKTTTNGHVSFTIALNGVPTTRDVVVPMGENVAEYFISGDFYVTYQVKCATDKCDRIYLISWIADVKKGLTEATVGVMKSLDGSKLLGDKDQISIVYSEAISAQGMINSLDQQISGEE